MEFRKIRIGDICTIKHGFAFKGNYITAEKNNNILVTPGNFKIGGGFKEEKNKYFKSEDFPQNYILKDNDLIVTMTDLSKNGDTLGYSALVPVSKNKRYLHNQRIGLVENIKEDMILKKFLYWFMRTKNYHQQLVNSSTGTTVKHTAPTRILTIEMPYPTIGDQNKIVKILDNIERKIELNNQINNKLYEIVIQMYNNLFLNLEKWKELKLEDIGNISSGKRPKIKLEKGMYPLIGANGKMGYTSEYNFDKDIIITGRVGTLGVVKRYYKKIWASDNTLIIETKYKNYIENYLKTLDYSSLNRGSTQPLLTQTDLKNEKILFNDGIVSDFELKAEKFVNKIRNNEEENEILEQLRDILLPKLMKGEIDLDKIEW